MRELPNLKVRALAVDVPEWGVDFSVGVGFDNMFMRYWKSKNGVYTDTYEVELPSGEWVFIGRAHELTQLQMGKVILIGIGQLCSTAWFNYCSANGLTNELILCEG